MSEICGLTWTRIVPFAEQTYLWEAIVPAGWPFTVDQVAVLTGNEAHCETKTDDVI